MRQLEPREDLTQAAAPRPIRTLSPLLVNQIAAGEVVERPASVVKELLDNALDAGATRITVELEGGGVELIRITDDGAGIPAADLPLALAPHATSKIAAVTDLDRIATLGFRGEALASIASVSRMSIRSRQAADTGASLLESEADRVGDVQPAPGPIGTSVTVRNLFFNTPARRKFLRTPATEQGHCLDVVEQLAMSHPDVGFTATCDGRAALDLPAGQSPRERLLAVLGRELESQLIEVHADRFDDPRGMALWGMIGLPAIARHTARAQHIFLNGRPIRDKSVQHAIREAYRGLIEPGRYPTAAVMLEMDPGAVDINVHPQKIEVRFRDQSMVHSVVLRSLRDALRAADLTPAIERTTWTPPIVDAGIVRAPSASSGSSADVQPNPGPSAFADYLRRITPAQPNSRLSYDTLRDALAPPAPPTPHSDLPTPRPADRVLQVHNSYVVTEDEHGIVIVDQHALHERIMFEELLARIGAGNLESQRMLVPPVVAATRSQFDRLTDLAPLLNRLGIDLEPIGPLSIAVQSFPSFLFDRAVDPAPFVTELLEKAEADGFSPGSEGALHEVLDMMACKAAVKAGEHMGDSELRDLLRLRDAVERSSNCPHGRPTSIRMTIRELDRRFGRT